jgi:hypothetical protein
MHPLVAPGLNISCTPVFYEKYGMEPVQRSHWFPANPDDVDPTGERGYFFSGMIRPEDIGNGGTGLWKPVGDAIAARNIRTMMETSLVGVVATPDKEVLGVKVESGGNTLYIKAKKGVVLGTGSYVTNPEMVLSFQLTPYTPNFWGGGGTLSLPNEDTGEGLQAAFSLGADTLFVGAGDRGGIKIDTEARVIDVYSEVIPRLYAGGRTAGGMVPPEYPCGGTYVGSALCMGRIAGKNAAALDPWDWCADGHHRCRYSSDRESPTNRALPVFVCGAEALRGEPDAALREWSCLGVGGSVGVKLTRPGPTRSEMRRRARATNRDLVVLSWVPLERPASRARSGVLAANQDMCYLLWPFWTRIGPNLDLDVVES